jgi:hypothetical protein
MSLMSLKSFLIAPFKTDDLRTPIEILHER